MERDFGRSDPDDPFAIRLTTQECNEHLDHITRRTKKLGVERETVLNPDIAWLGVKNCMINLVTGEVQPFDPKFMCTNKIPVNYDFGYATGVYADFFRCVEGGNKNHQVPA